MSENKVDSGDITGTITSTKLSPEHAKKLHQLVEAIPTILGKLDNREYDEIFGWRINVDGEAHVDVNVRNEILLKFLVANEYDVSVTIDKVVGTLNWRNKFQPLSAAFDEKFDSQLTTLGVITDFGAKPNLKVTTWNLYGNLKNPKKIFEDFGDESGSVGKVGSPFLRWRIGLMEKSLTLVDFTSTDNNRIAQVHDYNGVSMFKIDPGMKAATKEIVTIFGDNYPELLSIKFFVNVPVLMGWVFTFFKKLGIISSATLKKFQIMSGGDLTEWFGAEKLPKEYNGGKSSSVKSIFDLEAGAKAKIPEYGDVLLKKLGSEKIAAINDDVE